MCASLCFFRKAGGKENDLGLEQLFATLGSNLASGSSPVTEEIKLQKIGLRLSKQQKIRLFGPSPSAVTSHIEAVSLLVHAETKSKVLAKKVNLLRIKPNAVLATQGTHCCFCF